ncbi:nuclear transport factor 2 family protein [Algoriphagus sp. D3-2-R+10]|uniref:nuclear transport factor 2 family protein n=1 Tax=Algoriphagus aurantiacus TaxID=3103948 RepID=UPI002B3F952C|nr:nuclear transport factor 2 family protein [Algoriphagus sp. D3-2-R+10]MEB2775111.1 nuclear transport factor 2 family protein [Algoriphagus sp. D3-2-R+10]
MKKVLFFITLLAFSFSCSNENRKETEQESLEAMSEEVMQYDEDITQSVVDHHLKAFIGNDLNETMADYTEESILITPYRTYRGLAEIQLNFENAFAALPKDSTTVTVSKNTAIRDVGYIIWEADAPKLNFSYCSDTFIIQNGKIVSQTFAGIITPK